MSPTRFRCANSLFFCPLFLSFPFPHPLSTLITPLPTIDGYNVEQMGNRLEISFVLLSFIGTSIAWFQSFSRGTPGKGFAFLSIFPCLALLRTFIFWKTSLRFLFMVKAALTSLISLIFVMFCVFFMYGVLGVSMFGNVDWSEDALSKEVDGEVGTADYMANESGKANFQTLGHAMIALIQGFVGESFNDIMGLVFFSFLSFPFFWFPARTRWSRNNVLCESDVAYA